MLRSLLQFWTEKTKALRNKEVRLVKVQWQRRRGSEWTGEQEDEMRVHYPDLFVSADFENEVKIKWGRVVTFKIHVFYLTP